MRLDVTSKQSAAMNRVTINVALALPLGNPRVVAVRQVVEAYNALHRNHHLRLLEVDIELLRYAIAR